MPVTFDASAKTASNTIKLPNSEKLTLSLAWPRLTAPGSDIVLDVVITPNRKVNMKLGFDRQPGEGFGFLKFYMDAIGANPSIGDYKFSRNLASGESKGRRYDLKWTGQDKVSKGPLAAFSPMDNDVHCDITTGQNNQKGHTTRDAWKTHGGKKMGFNGWHSNDAEYYFGRVFSKVLTDLFN